MRRWPIIVLLEVLLLLGLSRLGTAQDDQPLPSTVTTSRDEGQKSVENDAEPDSERPLSPQRAAEKRKKATIALAAIGGIAILGVGAMAATMLWARRLRRLARDPGPPQKTAGNDFWFLKPPKQDIVPSDNANDSQPPDSPPFSETPK